MLEPFSFCDYTIKYKYLTKTNFNLYVYVLKKKPY